MSSEPRRDPVADDRLTPPNAAFLNDWNSLARVLRDLHAALLRRARTEYMRERGIAEEIGPGELLMLATRDESFAWLRSLSELMTDIDYLRDDPAIAKGQELRSAVRGAVEELLRPPGDEAAAGAFAVRYGEHVNADPDVTMAHAAVKQALAGWPPPQGTGHKEVAQHRQMMGKRRGS
jgi:hypothetical protein